MSAIIKYVFAFALHIFCYMCSFAQILEDSLPGIMQQRLHEKMFNSGFHSIKCTYYFDYSNGFEQPSSNTYEILELNSQGRISAYKFVHFQGQTIKKYSYDTLGYKSICYENIVFGRNEERSKISAILESNDMLFSDKIDPKFGPFEEINVVNCQENCTLINSFYANSGRVIRSKLCKVRNKIVAEISQSDKLFSKELLELDKRHLVKSYDHNGIAYSFVWRDDVCEIFLIQSNAEPRIVKRIETNGNLIQNIYEYDNSGIPSIKMSFEYE